MGFELITPRLRIRSWQQRDLEPWSALCADPEVMRFFPKRLSPLEARAWIDRQQTVETQHGYCFWAVETLEHNRCIGMTGLHPLHIEGIISGEVEIGWRLCRSAWGKGYATEAAKACRTYAHDVLQRRTLYAVASAINAPSLRVMEKLDMQPVRQFIHPLLPLGSDLQPCVLYAAEL